MLAFIRILIAVLIVGILATAALWLFGGRRTYRDATWVMGAVLALAVAAMVGWGIYERRSGHAADDPALVRDAERTLYEVQPSSFDRAADCLYQLGVVAEFSGRHPARYAEELPAARRGLEQAGEALAGRDPKRVLCADLPELQTQVATGQARLRAAARTR